MTERIQHEHAHKFGDEEIGEIVRGSAHQAYTHRERQSSQKMVLWVGNRENK